MDCDSKQYKDLITFLCKEKNVKLYKLDSRTLLGEMCGLCRFDEDNQPKNVRKTSTCVIKYLPEGALT